MLSSNKPHFHPRLRYLFVRYLAKSKTTADRSLQALTEKRLFMSVFYNKVAGLQPKKKKPWQKCFSVSLSLISEHFFQNNIWLVTASAKCHFLCCIDLNCKILLLTLILLWSSLNICGENASRLWTAVSGRSRQLVGLLLIKQALFSYSFGNRK